jgi:hypothetical protein
VGSETKRDMVWTRKYRSLLQRGCPLRIAKAWALDTKYVEPSGARMRNLTRCPPFALTNGDAKHGRPCGGKEIEEEPWLQLVLFEREETSASSLLCSVVLSYENVSVMPDAQRRNAQHHVRDGPLLH